MVRLSIYRNKSQVSEKLNGQINVSVNSTIGVSQLPTSKIHIRPGLGERKDLDNSPLRAKDRQNFNICMGLTTYKTDQMTRPSLK